MANGLNPNKKRRFPISKIKESLQRINSYEVEEQLNILESRVIIEKPSLKSARLVRNMSQNDETYLKEHCQYNDQEISGLKKKIYLLTD